MGQFLEDEMPTADQGLQRFIALLSKNVKNAEGARWEIRCAIEENVPLLGVRISADDFAPPEIKGKRIIRWTWDGIGYWINQL